MKSLILARSTEFHGGDTKRLEVPKRLFPAVDGPVLSGQRWYLRTLNRPEEMWDILGKTEPLVQKLKCDGIALNYCLRFLGIHELL